MDSCANFNDTLDLLIVGAGPVGLTAALEAQRLGLSVRIIERKKQRSVHDSRALVVHPRVMELLESIRGGKLTNEIANSAFHLQGMFAYLPKWYDWLPGCGMLSSGNSNINSNSNSNSNKESKEESKGKDDLYDPVHLDLNSVEWGDTEYPNLYFLPQYETERILEEAFVAEGGKIEYGVSLEDLEQYQGLVTTTLHNTNVDNDTNATDTTSETVESRWVLGADGGRSKTRELIGVELHRHRSDLFFVIADVVLKGDPPLSSHAPGLEQHVFPSGPCAMLPLPAKNAYRLIGRAPDGVRSNDQVTLDAAFFVDFLKLRTGKTFELELGPWQTVFEITHGWTDSYRNGNVMLAGDASHVHSPVGGQGMNLGMQDANNLLWKIAWSKRLLEEAASSSNKTEREEASNMVDAILETYNTERQSIGQELVKSVSFSTKMIAIQNPIAKFLRNEMIRMMLPSDTAKKNFPKVGQLELAYAPASSSFILESNTRFWNWNWNWNYKLTNHNSICSPGQRLPNIRLEDGSHLHSHINRVKHTWVVLNTEKGPEGEGETPFSAKENAVIVHAMVSRTGEQVSVPAISEQAYAAPQVLLVRPDQFVAGISTSIEDLVNELKLAGLTEMALATM